MGVIVLSKMQQDKDVGPEKMSRGGSTANVRETRSWGYGRRARLLPRCTSGPVRNQLSMLRTSGSVGGSANL